jgi:hypothetical protein
MIFFCFLINRKKMRFDWHYCFDFFFTSLFNRLNKLFPYYTTHIQEVVRWRTNEWRKKNELAVYINISRTFIIYGGRENCWTNKSRLPTQYYSSCVLHRDCLFTRDYDVYRGTKFIKKRKTKLMVVFLC